jgi:hypothetical protein
MSKSQIWPSEHVGCIGDCGWEAPEPDELDGTPQDGGVSDPWETSGS